MILLIALSNASRVTPSIISTLSGCLLISSVFSSVFSVLEPLPNKPMNNFSINVPTKSTTVLTKEPITSKTILPISLNTSTIFPIIATISSPNTPNNTKIPATSKIITPIIAITAIATRLNSNTASMNLNALKASSIPCSITAIPFSRIIEPIFKLCSVVFACKSKAQTIISLTHFAAKYTILAA